MTEDNPLTGLLANIKDYDRRIVIFSSFYKVFAYANYIASMATTIATLEKLKIEWDYISCTGEQQPHRALNVALTNAMQSDRPTDLINIDSDISWEPNDLLRILCHKEDIVAASYRMSNRPNQYVGDPLINPKTGKIIGKMVAEDETLIRASGVGAGFMLFSYDAMFKFVAAYPDRWFKKDGKKIYRFFGDEPYQNNEPVSNDIAFSRHCYNADINVWIDPHIHLTHWNPEGYKGNYHDYLNGETDKNDSFKAIKEMAKNIPKGQ